MPSRISEVFTRAKAEQRLAFMPFITAGDPDLATTQALIRELGQAGVDLIEVGFPYSDPIADGPVIQASYTRALAKHVHVHQILSALGELKNESLPPLVAMVSYAIVFRFGIEKFLDQCVSAGLAGVILPDLPGTEANDVLASTRQRGLDLIQLVAPTTPRERFKQIAKACSGFVYCVAVSGTTGERTGIQSELIEQLRWLRQETDLPLAVGFGISRPEHLEPLRGLADGAIVGSAIVRKLEQVAKGAATSGQAVSQVGNFAREMVAAAKAGISR